jgi:hypothetical protein
MPRLKPYEFSRSPEPIIEIKTPDTTRKNR